MKKKASKKRGRGRPAVGPEDRRTARLQVLITPAELIWVVVAAEGEGLTISEWCRRTLLAGCRSAADGAERS